MANENLMHYDQNLKIRCMKDFIELKLRKFLSETAALNDERDMLAEA